MEIEKIDMNYKKFKALPADIRVPIEQIIVKLAAEYFNSGDSMSVAIAKTYHDSFLKRKIVETTIRENAELMSLFKSRSNEKLTRRWANA